jgi:ATP phosphoribosyltransferase
MNTEPLSLALPKGRLEEQVLEYLEERGIEITVEKRKLTAIDKQGSLKVILVKNSDLPTYVQHGIAGLGVCGEDVIYESGLEFSYLQKLPFGSTKMCLAAKKDSVPNLNGSRLSIATKFIKFTKDYFHNKGIPVELIKLNGSVELAPVLGLSPFIVDLVETGSTLKANNLEVVQELQKIEVHLIANPSYLKFHYKKIQKLLEILKS